MNNDLTELLSEFGGYWGEHPEHTVEDWQYFVANGDTRQGYWEWVQDQIEARKWSVGCPE